MNVSKTFQIDGHTIFLQYPTSALPPNATGWPSVVFMHGLTLGWEWYSRHVEHWASHGFVVAFPFVKSVDKDDGIIPVTETDANSIYIALEMLKGIANGTIRPPTDLKAPIDVHNVGLVGHSMGGEDTIRAAAGVRVPKGMSALPSGTLKVAVAQHPSLCTFPPPYPYTINKAEINAASQKAPLLLFTAENDRAFLPYTPSVEHKCWQAAQGQALFASFKKSVCETYPPCSSMIGATDCTAKLDFVGSGHMCACDAPGLDTWTSPELKWVTAALRLYLHEHSASSGCGAMLWGDKHGSLSNDPNVASVETHSKHAQDETESIHQIVV